MAHRVIGTEGDDGVVYTTPGKARRARYVEERPAAPSSSTRSSEGAKRPSQATEEQPDASDVPAKAGSGEGSKPKVLLWPSDNLDPEVYLI